MTPTADAVPAAAYAIGTTPAKATHEWIPAAAAMPARPTAAAATTAGIAATATVNVAVAGKDNLMCGGDRCVGDHRGRCGDDHRDGSPCHEHFPFDQHISRVLALSAYRHPFINPDSNFRKNFVNGAALCIEAEVVPNTYTAEPHRT